MGNPLTSNIELIPGILIADPTDPDLSGASPFGGKILGKVRDSFFEPGQQQENILAEEFGGLVTEVIHTGDTPILGTVLREMDDDMMGHMFVETSDGTVSGKKVVQRTSAFRAGQVRTTSAVKLLFEPNDTLKHKFIILYRAIPLIDESAQFLLTAEDDISFGAFFMATRDANGKIFQMAKKEDISLT